MLNSSSSDKIEISMKKYLVIEVRDTGSGISEEMQRQINQSEEFVTGKQGVGLGISICKSICQGLGGKLRYTSEIGKGTVFYATIEVQNWKEMEAECRPD